jgi:bacteriorhodopsin
MLSYLVMATGMGITYVAIKETASHGAIHLYRQVYWARKLEFSSRSTLVASLVYSR